MTLFVLTSGIGTALAAPLGRLITPERKADIGTPVVGLVESVMVKRGECVEDRPLLHLAAIDRLRVEVVVPAAQFCTIANGTPATVQPDLPGVDAVKAEVSLVDPLVDAASNTFRVRLAIDNSSGTVPAGARCKVDFGGVQPASYQRSAGSGLDRELKLPHAAR